MKQHRYRITVEHLADAQGAPSAHTEPLSFEVGNHDDIIDIVRRVRERGDLDVTSATAMAVGLKLFSEVMLENRDHQLFQEFAPHFRDFMKEPEKGTLIITLNKRRQCEGIHARREVRKIQVCLD